MSGAKSKNKRQRVDSADTCVEEIEDKKMRQEKEEKADLSDSDYSSDEELQTVGIPMKEMLTKIREAVGRTKAAFGVLGGSESVLAEEENGDDSDDDLRLCENTETEEDKKKIDQEFARLRKLRKKHQKKLEKTKAAQEEKRDKTQHLPQLELHQFAAFIGILKDEVTKRMFSSSCLVKISKQDRDRLQQRLITEGIHKFYANGKNELAYLLRTLKNIMSVVERTVVSLELKISFSDQLKLAAKAVKKRELKDGNKRDAPTSFYLPSVDLVRLAADLAFKNSDYVPSKKMKNVLKDIGYDININEKKKKKKKTNT